MTPTHETSGEHGACSPALRCYAPVPGVAVLAIALFVTVLAVGARRVGEPVLVAGSAIPASGRLLWLDGRPSVRGQKTVAARDSLGRVLLFDDRLHVQEAALPGDVASVVSAAPADDDGAVWVVDGHGRLLRVNPDGKVTAEIPTPYVVPAIGGGSDDGVIALVRSVEGFPFPLDTAPEPPVVLVDATGRQVRRLGTSVVPAHVLLTDLANTGHVVRIGDQTVFAPFVRDEIIAFGPQGDTLWIVHRGLRHETPEPRFVMRDGRPVLDYFPVNLGLGVGPDGRLYALSTADTTLGHARLDVLDPSSGEMLATLPLPTAFPTIVVTRRGEVHLVSSGTLLARAAGAARPQMPAFDWPDLGGERVTDAALHGRVTIVNAWASWCAPCREEMPALANLWHALADSGLALLAVNEDVQAEDARRWLRDTDLDLPVVLAGGRGRGVLHYPGLPYTMLVDREGRIVRKWVGYLGPEQIEAIGAAARRELGADRGTDTKPSQVPGGMSMRSRSLAHARLARVTRMRGTRCGNLCRHGPTSAWASTRQRVPRPPRDERVGPRHVVAIPRLDLRTGL